MRPSTSAPQFDARPPEQPNAPISEVLQPCENVSALSSPKADQLIELGLSWNGIPLDVWLEPWRPTPEQVQRLRLASAAFYRAATRATQRFVDEPQMRRRFGYGDVQQACILAEPGYAPEIPVGRVDLYLDGNELKFLEFNTDGAAGWHWLSGLEALSSQARGAPTGGDTLATRLLHTLLACFRRWDRKGVQEPRIAIVDWKDVATRSEQLALARTFGNCGVPCTLEDPRELVVEQGRLLGSEGPIDLVYRRLVSEEAFARADEVRAFLDGYVLGAACYVGGFRTDPAWSKTLFAVLSDAAFQRDLSASDRAWIQSTVPWTVAVAQGAVLSDELQACDLELRLRTEPARYIIKPARGYAGKGICAGAVSDKDVWNLAVTRLFAEGNWVVQEYCTPPVFDGPHRNGFKFFHGMVFLLEGEIAGVGARCSRTPILGSTTPEVWLPVDWPRA